MTTPEKPTGHVVAIPEQEQYSGPIYTGQLLESLSGAGFQDIFIGGYMPDGSMMYIHSDMTVAEVNLLLDQLKQEVLQEDEDE